MRPIGTLLVALLTLSACATPSPASLTAADFAPVDAGGQVAYARPPLSQRGVAEPDRQLVRTARLAVEVDGDDRVGPTLDEAHAVTAALGGYVSQEGPGESVLRIPDARLDDAIDRIGALGKETTREIRVQDVTAAYTDLELRLTNARALQTRLRDLLTDAESVADVLAVEVELARVSSEVERLEGQLRLLQNQVAFSTLHVRVTDGVTPGPVGWLFVGAYEAVKWLFVWD